MQVFEGEGGRKCFSAAIKVKVTHFFFPFFGAFFSTPYFNFRNKFPDAEFSKTDGKILIN